jgi:enamine deaminase RidA (YjgF/YER057c/UK114 family)
MSEGHRVTAGRRRLRALRVHAEFFPADKPARSATQAKLVVDSKIEIEAIAVKR